MVHQQQDALGRIESNHAFWKDPLLCVKKDVEADRRCKKSQIDDDLRIKERSQRWMIREEALMISGGQ
jgi:hypothetical protein